MESLIYLTPLGLALDAVGFLIVVIRGHNTYMRFGINPPDPDTGRQGDVYFQYASSKN